MMGRLDDIRETVGYSHFVDVKPALEASKAAAIKVIDWLQPRLYYKEFSGR